MFLWFFSEICSCLGSDPKGGCSGFITAGHLTTVTEQTPAGGDTGHASWVVVSGPGQADRGHVGAQAGGCHQLDEGNVVVDGPGVPFGMSEHLERSTMNIGRALNQLSKLRAL